jgi:hypothetical protein
MMAAEAQVNQLMNSSESDLSAAQVLSPKLSLTASI